VMRMPGDVTVFGMRSWLHGLIDPVLILAAATDL
jgi:hypothetical protein